MNNRERFLKALKGEEVDRVPIWLREGIAVVNPPAEAEDYQRGWQADPIYRDLLDYVRPHVVDFSPWGLPGNRFLMVPPSSVEWETIEDTPVHRIHKTTIKTPKGELHQIAEINRNEATNWVRKPMVESIDELEALAAVPFEVDKEAIRNAVKGYHKAQEQAGDQWLPRAFLSSPVVCISGAMHLEDFLEFTYTHRDLAHALTEETTNRILANLEVFFDIEDPDSTFTFGGSEQCTPPMMPAAAFDEFVVPYEGRIVQWLKERGKVVNIHCHGKVGHALRGMIEMGADSTEPVEPPPQGDVTWAEARAIAGDDLTLIGNLEFSELETLEPAEIKKRVCEILSTGKRRVVLGASAGPITHVTPRLAGNFKAWIDAALEYGDK
ncbi:MAG: uroporphyrinogen decarboxylase family protein [Candidatus Sumerlaeota bacterium]